MKHAHLYLQVTEDALVERVVGRRLDPVTGKIYHLKYSPPETEEITARLTRRFDDTEEKVCSKLVYKSFWVIWLSYCFSLVVSLSCFLSLISLGFVFVSWIFRSP